MKIGYYAESKADQAAIKILVEGILGEITEPIEQDLEARGVSNVLKTVGAVYTSIFWGSDAQGLVIVVDSDNSELHQVGHVPSHQSKCRYCDLAATLARTRQHLSARPCGFPLRVAIGLAVPAVEAWYLVGKEHGVGEAAWNTTGQPRIDRRQLKRLLYGTDRPQFEHATRLAVEHTERLKANYRAIEDAFPIGFGLMAKEIRSWKTS